MVILLDLNSVAWMNIESNKENDLRIVDLFGVLIDCIFLRYLQN